MWIYWVSRTIPVLAFGSDTMILGYLDPLRAGLLLEFFCGYEGCAAVVGGWVPRTRTAPSKDKKEISWPDTVRRNAKTYHGL